jgi:hypothetical protein
LLWLIWSVWLNETNQMNKINQMNQINPSRPSRSAILRGYLPLPQGYGPFNFWYATIVFRSLLVVHIREVLLVKARERGVGGANQTSTGLFTRPAVDSEPWQAAPLTMRQEEASRQIL